MHACIARQVINWMVAGELGLLMASRQQNKLGCAVGCFMEEEGGRGGLQALIGLSAYGACGGKRGNAWKAIKSCSAASVEIS